METKLTLKELLEIHVQAPEDYKYRDWLEKNIDRHIRKMKKAEGENRYGDPVDRSELSPQALKILEKSEEHLQKEHEPRDPRKAFRDRAINFRPVYDTVSRGYGGYNVISKELLEAGFLYKYQNRLVVRDWLLGEGHAEE